MNIKSTLQLLRYATPFYKERYAQSTTLIEGSGEFNKRFETWVRSKLEELLEIAKSDPETLYAYLNMLANFITQRADIDFSGSVDDMVDYANTIADSMSGGGDTIVLYPGTVEAHVAASGPAFIFCLLKYDIITALFASKMPQTHLNTVFPEILQVPKKTSVLILGGSLMYLDFAKRHNRPRTAPFWTLFEPLDFVSSEISVSFRSQTLDFNLSAPIYTSALDYWEMPTTTQGLQTYGSCDQYPHSVTFSYDPYRDFSLIKNFRPQSNTFSPVSRYGENLEVFAGPSLFCVKAGDIDLQTISSTCDLRRIGQVNAKVDSARKIVEFKDPQGCVFFKYTSSPEDAYYLYLKFRYQVQ